MSKEKAQIENIFFDCKVAGCHKKFTTKKALNEHKRTHKGSRHFQCEVCDQKFTQYSSLQKHGRVHDKRKPFTCDFDGCSSAFTQVSNLIRHKRIHTGEKPYKCDKCNKSFASGSNLKQHKNTHNSFKKRSKFKCEFCGEKDSKEYLYQNSLRKHMQIAHREEYEKLCDQYEVDKSPVIRTKQGKVFMIELVDKALNHIDEVSNHENSEQSVKDEPKEDTQVLPPRPRRKLRRSDNSMGLNTENPASGVLNEGNILNPGVLTRSKIISRENSFVRQSSILSEISQPVNDNNLADLLEKAGVNPNNLK